MVEHEKHVIGQSGVEPRNFVACCVCAGRVVGVGKEDDPGPVSDRSQNRVDIGRIVIVRCDHRRRADAPCRDFVNGKAISHIDDFIARAGECARRLMQHFIGSSPVNDPGRIEAIMRGNRLTQGRGAAIGIAFEPPGLCGKGGTRLLTRPERILVRRQLGCFGAAIGRRFAGDIGMDRRDPVFGCGSCHDGRGSRGWRTAGQFRPPVVQNFGTPAQSFGLAE